MLTDFCYAQISNRPKVARKSSKSQKVEDQTTLFVTPHWMCFHLLWLHSNHENGIGRCNRDRMWRTHTHTQKITIFKPLFFSSECALTDTNIDTWCTHYAGFTIEIHFTGIWFRFFRIVNLTVRPRSLAHSHALCRSGCFVCLVVGTV